MRNLHKRTSGPNEVRHKHYKHVSDRVETNFYLAKSDDSTNKKVSWKRMQKEASGIVSGHLKCDGLDYVEKICASY